MKIKPHYKILFPPYFWLVTFFLLPLIILFIYSFGHKGNYGGVVFDFTFNNYINIIDPLYFKMLIRSIWYAFISTVISLLIGYPMAYFISSSSDRMKSLLMFLIILPFWTNFLIRIFSWVIILGDNGIINKSLLFLGLIDQPLTLLYNEFSVIVGLIYGELPYMILPIIASLDKLDRTLLEASTDLGASKFKTFFKITFPLSIPGVVTGIIFVFIPALGQFVVPDILGSSSSFMIGNIITNQFLQVRDWPFGSAISMILMMAVSLGIYFYIKYANPNPQKK